VRYIVEQTVGKLIANKSPDDIATMRFADIACGSGSFLIGVLDCLLRYHTRYYNEFLNRHAWPTKRSLPNAADEKSRRPRSSTALNATGGASPTLEKKRQILLNNIYGVDLDAQAVEVASSRFT